METSRDISSIFSVFWTVTPALFSRWTTILSYYFTNAMKIHKFILCNTLVMGWFNIYSVDKYLFHKKQGGGSAHDLFAGL